jgi:predicted DsbA family dithiol-disulfide isomerase
VQVVGITGVVPEVRYRAFQLQPGLPAEGVPAQEFFSRKFGSRDRVQGIFERLTALGRQEGIAFDFQSQTRAPNTELAHRVIHFAGIRQEASATIEAMFVGYFEQGLNLCALTDIVAMLRTARVALDLDELTAAMASGAGKAEVASDLAKAREYGIGGVPLFIFDERYTVEGAQPLEHFCRLIDRLKAENTPHLRAQMLL